MDKSNIDKLGGYISLNFVMFAAAYGGTNVLYKYCESFDEAKQFLIVFDRSLLLPPPKSAEFVINPF